MATFAWFFAPLVRAALGVVPPGVLHTPTWAAVVPQWPAWTAAYAADFDARGISASTANLWKPASDWYVLPRAMVWLLQPCGGAHNTSCTATSVAQHVFDDMCTTEVHVLRRYVSHLPQYCLHDDL